MLVPRSLSRTIRLPLDLVRLTVDWARGVIYRALEDAPWLALRMRAPVCGLPENGGRCLRAEKYGNLELMRLLCSRDCLFRPDLTDEKSKPRIFDSEDRAWFYPETSGLFLVGLLLALVWGASIIGAVAVARRYAVTSATPPIPSPVPAGDAMPENYARRYAKQGERLFAQGMYREAIAPFRNAALVEPDCVEAHLMIAECYLRVGNPSKAGPSLLKAVNLRSDALPDKLKVGPPPLDPRNPAFHLAMAELFLLNRDASGAETCFRRALDLDVRNADARLGLAKALRLDGKFDEALRFVEEALARDPLDPRAGIEQAEIAAGRGETDFAIFLYGRLVERDPNAFARCVRRAELLRRTGRDNEAYEAATSVLQQNPGNPQAHLVLARIFRAKGLHVLAAEHARKAAVSLPDDVPTLSLLAEALVQESDWNDAVVVLERALRRAPDDFDLLLMMGDCRRALGMDRRAIACYMRAARAKPHAARPYLHLAELRALRGNVEEAIEACETALRKEPEDRTAARRLALLRLDHGLDLEAGFHLAREIYRRHPEDPSAADAYGWARYRKGDIDAACELLARAARKLSADPEVRYRFAAALEAKGDLAGAREQIDRALLLSRDFDGADAARALRDRLQNVASQPVAARRQPGYWDIPVTVMQIEDPLGGYESR